MSYDLTYLRQQQKSDSYQQFIKRALYLSNKPRADYMQADMGKKSLRRMRRLLELAAVESDDFKQVVLIAGTSGKGSLTWRLHAAISTVASVSSYYSPALINWCDSVMTPPQSPIAAKDLLMLYEKLLSRVESASWLPESGWPSHFEMMTAITMMHAKALRSDYLLLEVGCGGRFDATNAVKHQGCVFTPIALDHQHLLGSDLAAISHNKAGIMQGARWAVSCPQDKVVAESLQACAEQYNCTLEFSAAFQPFNVDGSLERLAQRLGEKIVGETLTSPAAQTKLMGRFQALRWNRCEVILDGAHNPSKCAALVERLRQHGWADVDVVLAVRSTKDVKMIINTLQPIARRFFVTQARDELGETTMPATQLFEVVRASCNKPVEIVQSQAHLANVVADRLLLTGSFLLLGQWLRQEDLQER